MDGSCFDDLTRTLAAGLNRRAALKVAAGGLLGVLGLRTAEQAGAQVSQVQCGNVPCASNYGVCGAGCVCCLYRNARGQVTNSRCRPPGQCSPGEVACPSDRPVLDGTGRCVATQPECYGPAECNDGDACTTNTCVNGACVSQPITCDDGDPCTTNGCDPASGCFFIPVSSGLQGGCGTGRVCCPGLGCTALGTDAHCAGCGDACVGTGVTCGGGGTPGMCGCTDNGDACAGRVCGTAETNCGVEVTCGPGCQAGQACNAASQCVCTPESCPAGCCQDGACRIDDNLACGTGGGECVACTGTGVTCGGGGTPGMCGCTDNGEACAGRVCGTADTNCGAAEVCGPGCQAGQACTAAGQCECTPESCPSGCCDATGACRIDDNLACGTGGGECVACTGAGVTCGGGGTDGVCGCTPPPDAETCAGGCGTVQNICGQTVDCTALCGGCCDGSDVCQGGTTMAACGSGGEVCDVCTGTDAVCTPAGNCACTPRSCTAAQCGQTIDDGCGSTLTCLPCPTTFGYTGTVQTYIVPAGVTRVRIVASGAQGGAAARFGPGGLGGRATGTVAVTPGQRLVVLVGQAGQPGTSAAGGEGGFNGGGRGGAFDGGGGGGASEVRTSPPLNSRLVVGGGGGGTGSGGRFAGGGGGASGVTGSNGGTGGGGGGQRGTATAGGAGGAGQSSPEFPASPGGSGNPTSGGAGGSGNGGGGGGGGGWFGGGGGGNGPRDQGGSGGGGSGFVVSTATDPLNLEGRQTGDGSVTITPIA